MYADCEECVIYSYPIPHAEREEYMGNTPVSGAATYNQYTHGPIFALKVDSLELHAEQSRLSNRAETTIFIP